MDILNLVKFNFKINYKQILGWSIAIFAIMFLYMILFPSIKDIGQAKLDAMPQELLQLFGMNDLMDLSNFVSYFQTIYILIILVISVFAVIFASSLLAKEEYNKTIEFLYALPVSRIDIYLAKLIVGFIGVLLVIASAIIATLLAGFINGGDTFKVMEVLTIAKVSGFTPFFFLSLGFLIAGVQAKYSATSIGSGCVMFAYLISYLSTILEDKGEFLGYLTPFEVFSTNNALNLTNDNLIMMVVYSIVMLVFIGIGLVVYNKRDFKI